MTHVSTQVTLSISPTGQSFEAIEAQIAQSLKQAGKDLLIQACQAMEANVLQQNHKLRRCKKRKLHLITRFGWIRLSRIQVRDDQGRFFCPLDQVLLLQPRQHASPWVLQQSIRLATRLPYRQAATLLSDVLEEEIDHRSLYRWVQKAGARLVAEEDALQQAVFEHGEVPPRGSEECELILAEVDGTFLRSQREEGQKFEVRLGLLATGKQLESRTAKHRRYRLLDRLRYAGVETAQDFGERFFLKGEAHLALSRSRHLLLVGDGADWIEALAGHDRWRATYQLDWWHLTHAFHRTFPDHPKLVRRLKRYLYRGDGDKIIPAVRLAQANELGDPERIETLIGYLEANQSGFYGAHQLRPHLSPEAREVCVYGSGAVEKHIDLVICRRFKGLGMRWSRAGANRLLKLRLIELDRVA